MPKNRNSRRPGAQGSPFATHGAPTALETYFRIWPSPNPFPPPVNPLFRDAGTPPDLLPVEDRRRFYPGNPFTGWEPAKRLSGAKPRLAATPLRPPPPKNRVLARSTPRHGWLSRRLDLWCSVSAENSVSRSSTHSAWLADDLATGVSAVAPTPQSVANP